VQKRGFILEGIVLFLKSRHCTSIKDSFGDNINIKKSYLKYYSKVNDSKICHPLQTQYQSLSLSDKSYGLHPTPLMPYHERGISSTNSPLSYQLTSSLMNCKIIIVIYSILSKSSLSGCPAHHKQPHGYLLLDAQDTLLLNQLKHVQFNSS
jgi:hypothetical protein